MRHLRSSPVKSAQLSTRSAVTLSESASPTTAPIAGVFMKTNQLVAARHLANGSTYAQAAQQAGVSERSIYGWLKRPEFQEAVKRQRGQVLDDLDGRLTGLAGKATETLENLLDSAEAGGVRLSAAKAVLDYHLRVHELAAIEKRLAALEDLADAHGKQTGTFGTTAAIDPQEVEAIARRLLADGDGGRSGAGEDPTTGDAHDQAGRNRPRTIDDYLPMLTDQSDFDHLDDGLDVAGYCRPIRASR